VEWHEETKRGYTLVSITPERVRGDFMELDTVKSKTFLVTKATSWETTYGPKPQGLVAV
jgi:hypothetical protein